MAGVERKADEQSTGSNKCWAVRNRDSDGGYNRGSDSNKHATNVSRIERKEYRNDRPML